jgi:hypothetical protein
MSLRIVDFPEPFVPTITYSNNDNQFQDVKGKHTQSCPLLIWNETLCRAKSSVPGYLKDTFLAE